MYLLSPLIWLYFVYRVIKSPDYLDHWKHRIGILPRSLLKHGILIHCASVGETIAAKPLIVELAMHCHQTVITVTTSTPTGRAEVNRIFAQLGENSFQHCFLPIDWPGSCRRFVNALQPKICILMETELWPNLLNEFKLVNIPAIVVNARLSEKSLKNYTKFPRLTENILSNISLVSTQYPSDSQNFRQLGLTEQQLVETGNMKFDLVLDDEIINKQIILKKQWRNDRPCWIAASIHPDEFELILGIHKKLLTLFPDLLLIAVPRHPEEFRPFKELCKKFGMVFTSRSDLQPPGEKDPIIVGDTMGEMLLMYAAADIAFVGGSFCNRGGHNPLEPAICGLSIITGPSIYNFSDICQIMQKQKCLQVVSNEEQLLFAIEQRLKDNRLLETQKQACRTLFEHNRGATLKNVNIIKQLLKRND